MAVMNAEFKRICCEIGAEALRRVIERAPPLTEDGEPRFNDAELRGAIEVLEAVARGQEVRLRPSTRQRPASGQQYVDRIFAALYDARNPAKTMAEAYRRATGVEETLSVHGSSIAARVREAQRAWAAYWRGRGVRFVPPWEVREWIDAGRAVERVENGEGKLPAKFPR